MGNKAIGALQAQSPLLLSCNRTNHFQLGNSFAVAELCFLKQSEFGYYLMVSSYARAQKHLCLSCGLHNMMAINPITNITFSITY